MKLLFRVLFLSTNFLLAQQGTAQIDSVQQKFYELTRTLIEKYNSNQKSDEVKSDILFLENVLPRFTQDFNYTNALYKLEIIKGRQALRNGNIMLAKEHLEKAGVALTCQSASGERIAFGSPQLRTFGPNMSLAKELLEKGMHDTVIRYFKQSSKVWDPQFSKLKEWEAQVKEGKIPDFGANLYY